MSPVNVARLERAAICDLFDELGPDQPTLCEGWTTRDLAAHLVTRERRPDAAVGILVKPVSGFTEQVRAAAAKRPFDELIGQLRRPPFWTMSAGPYHHAGELKVMILFRFGVSWMLSAMTSIRCESMAGISESKGMI